MGDFFKGWRRRFGVVTLVMATILVGAWTRSYFSDDRIPLPAFGNHDHAVILLVEGLWFTNEPRDVTDGDVPCLGAMVVNYWYLIISLTLLSAYLLSKPRPVVPKKVAESTPAEGA